MASNAFHYWVYRLHVYSNAYMALPWHQMSTHDKPEMSWCPECYMHDKEHCPVYNKPSEPAWSFGSKEHKQVVGALKSCISAHGPITKEWIGSAAKRVTLALKTYFENKKEPKMSRKFKVICPNDGNGDSTEVMDEYELADSIKMFTEVDDLIEIARDWGWKIQELPEDTNEFS